MNANRYRNTWLWQATRLFAEQLLLTWEVFAERCLLITVWNCIACGHMCWLHPSTRSSASNWTSWNSWSTSAFRSFTLKCMSSVNMPLLYKRSIELNSFCDDSRIGIALIARRISSFFSSSKSDGTDGSNLSFAFIKFSLSIRGSTELEPLKLRHVCNGQHQS